MANAFGSFASSSGSRLRDGDQSLPSIAFADDPDTGLFSSAENTIDFTTGGTKRLTLNSTALTNTLPYYAPNGTLETPSYSFTSDTNSGMFLSLDGEVSISTNGVSRAKFGASECYFAGSQLVQFQGGSQFAPEFCWSNDKDTGLYYAGTNSLGLSTGGTGRFIVNTATCDSALPLRLTGTTSYLLVNTTDRTYRSANNGATVDQPLQIGSSTGTSGFSYLGLDHAGGATDMGLNFNMLNANNQIIRTGCIVANSSSMGASRTAGSEVGNMSFQIKASSLGLVECFRLVNQGSIPQILATTGSSQSSPAYSFIGDTGTGIYRTTTNSLGISTNGTLRLTLNTASLTSTLPFYAPDGSSSAPSFTFSSDTNTGMYRHTTDILGFAANGAGRMFVANGYVEANVPFYNQAGSQGAPVYTFVSDNDTGLYLFGTNSIGITAGGAWRFVADPNATYASVPMQTANGSVSAPGFSFVNDTDCGMYRVGANNIGIAVGGTQYIDILGTGSGLVGTKVAFEARTSANVTAATTYSTNASQTTGVAKIWCSTSKTTGYYMLEVTNSENVFLVRADGTIYADGAYSTPAADYSEYFESSDGKTILVGTVVTLENGKVRPATVNDLPDDILGVVRPKKNCKGSSVVGNSGGTYWQGKYLTNEFGEYETEPHEVWEWQETEQYEDTYTESKEVYDEEKKETVIVEETKTETKERVIAHHSYESHRIPDGVVVPENKTIKTGYTHYKLNPEYNEELEFIAREDRDEWILVGILGQIPVRNDQADFIPANWKLMSNIGDGTVAKMYLVK